jgi:hypothetical protein
MRSSMSPDLKEKACFAARQVDVLLRDQLRKANDHGAVVNVFGRPAAGKTLVARTYCEMFSDARYLSPINRLQGNPNGTVTYGELLFGTILAAANIIFLDEPAAVSDMGEQLRSFSGLARGKVIVLLTHRCVWDFDGITPWLTRYRLDLSAGLRIVAGVRVEWDKSHNGPSLTVLPSPIAERNFPLPCNSRNLSTSH